MNGGIHREVEKQLEEKRARALQRGVQRREAIYAEIPEIRRLDRCVDQAGIYLGFLAMGRPCPNTGAFPELLQMDQAALENTMEACAARKRQLLVQHGFPEDYLTDLYDCPLCRDQGYVVENGVSRRCRCYIQILVAKLREASHLQDTAARYADFRTDVNPDIPNKEKYGIAAAPRAHMQNVLERCKNFTEHFYEDETHNMIFIGNAGLGKTFLFSCISSALLERGVPVLYFSAPALFRAFSLYGGTDSEEGEAVRELRKTAMSVDLLIIDDLGTEKQTGTRYSELLEILDTRARGTCRADGRRTLLRTIISTNLSPKNLFTYYGERVTSRLLGGFDLIRFAGDDVRLRRE